MALSRPWPFRLKANQCHRPATVTTAGYRFRDRDRRHHAQHPLHDFEQVAGVTVKKAVVPRPAKAFGQHMQQNQIEEQLTAFPPGFPVSTFAVTITESDMRSVILDDVPIADHPEVDPNDWTGTGTD